MKTNRRFLLLCASAFVASATLMPLASSADTLDDIKSRGKMTVAIDPTFAPYEYTDSTGKIVGYTPRIMGEVARRLNVKLDYQTMAFNGIIPGLLAKSFDLEGSTLNVTSERAKRVLFTVPFGKSVNTVMTRSDDSRFTQPVTIESLSGLTAIVKATTAPEKLLKDFNKTLAEKKLAPMTILSLETVEQTASALLAKRGDFIFDDISVIGTVLRQNPGKFQQVGELGEAQWMAWATRKEDTRLNQLISETILDMQKSGELRALQQQELGVTFEVPASGFIPAE